MWYLIILLKVSTAYLAYPEGTSLIYTYINGMWVHYVHLKETEAPALNCLGLSLGREKVYLI